MADYEFIGGSKSNFENAPKLTDWETYSNHREIVTGFIKSSAPPDARSLCVLGAGLCQDIELNQLVSQFSKTTLVDISHDDVAEGVGNQNLSNSDSIKIVEGCDLSGVHSALGDATTSLRLLRGHL